MLRKKNVVPQQPKEAQPVVTPPTQQPLPQPATEEKQMLESQVQMLTELNNLKDNEYFRYRQLTLLERIAVALEESLNEEPEAVEDETQQ